MTGKDLIFFERMKEQIENAFPDLPVKTRESLDLSIEFQKGTTRIKFAVPPLTDIMLIQALSILKKHVENIRITSFEKGHYGFQSLNSNIFNTENLTANFKIDFFSIVNSYVEISKKGDLGQEEINSCIGIIRTLIMDSSFDPRVRLQELGAVVMNGSDTPDWHQCSAFHK